jgi:SWIM zinc finger
MVLSLAKIEALAPDQAALDAARKLLKPGMWPTLACDEAGLVWGEVQGSGATPYRVVVSEVDAGYKCTCPSRKFPCKHSLALMWMRAEGKAAFASGTPPQWVNDWVSRRRGPSQAAPAADVAPKVSIAVAVSGGEEAAASDPKAEARAAAQRERNRRDREAAILAGLDEFDLWLSDQLEKGIAAFVAHAAGACRRMAQRLVDAKASALATRLDSLPARHRTA